VEVSRGVSLFHVKLVSMCMLVVGILCSLAIVIIIMLLHILTFFERDVMHNAKKDKFSFPSLKVNLIK